MDTSRKSVWVLGGSLAAAIGASVCCVGPLVLVVLGLGGAGAALALAPFRPYFLLLAVILLGVAFYWIYRRSPAACGPGQACDKPGANQAARWILWLTATLVLLFATFPYYSQFLF